jgi:hypothetical protein
VIPIDGRDAFAEEGVHLIGGLDGSPGFPAPRHPAGVDRVLAIPDGPGSGDQG